MPLSGYQALPPIDLASKAGQTFIVVQSGVEVYAVTVLDAPANYQASFKAGTGGQLIPLPGEGQGYELCPTTSEGIFVSVPSGQSGQLTLGINLRFTGSSQKPDPTLAAYGRANQVGSVNSGPAVQLYNDVGSGKILRVHAVIFASAVNGRVGLIRSPYKFTGAGGGVVTAGARQFLDSRQLDASLKGLIQGVSFDNGLPGGAGVINPNLYILGSQVSGGFVESPLYVPEQIGYLTEGNGLTVQHNQNGAGTSMDVYFIAEEL